VDIGNSGTSSGKIAAIYIENSSATLQSQSTISSVLFVTSIEIGKIKSFAVTYTYSAGATYYFKVVPSYGAALELQATSS
jgi:hypothetical protein